MSTETVQPTPSAAAPSVQDYAIEYSASGSEYFRIWIVNLALTVATLGLYLPWAKVRKLKYFYSNTHVDGHALDFHGDPKKMFRGFILAAVFFIVYSQSFQLSPIAGVVASIAMVVLWPLLYRGSMRFRMSNTSWRGLRFGFNGDVQQAYLALGLPLALILLPFAALTLAADAGGQPPSREVAQMVGMGFGVVMLGFYALLPLFLWLHKRYQHGHLQYGQVQAEFRAGVWDFYKIAIITFLIMLLVTFVIGLLAAMFMGMGFLAALFGRGRIGPGTIFALLILFAVAALVFNMLVRSYWVSRMQNLVWGRTGNSQFRFVSHLELMPFAWLQFKNYLLIILTLGLYWPFAVVATHRIKLGAMQLRSRLPLDSLVARAGKPNQDGLGDAAADLYGLDVGM
jgi:uncharacterized membrane protein YjgN (DUF898 family)